MCVFFFYFVKAPHPGAVSPDHPWDSVTIAQQVKYVSRNALNMFKALDKGFRQKCTVLLLSRVEGRLKSLKIQQ